MLSLVLLAVLVVAIVVLILVVILIIAILLAVLAVVLIVAVLLVILVVHGCVLLSRVVRGYCVPVRASLCNEKNKKNST